MIKKIVYIGLILLAVSIVSYYAVFSNTFNYVGYPNAYTKVYNNYTLSGNATDVFVFNSTYNTSNVYIETSHSRINAFLANSSGYSEWKALLGNSTGTAKELQTAKALEGKGVLILYENVTNATVPAYSGAAYYTNNSYLSLGVLGKGSFYFVSTLYNPSIEGKSVVNGTLVNNISIGNLAGKARSFSEMSILVTILFMISLVILLVGIIKQDNSKQNEDIKPEVVDELYKNIGKPDRGRHHAAKSIGSNRVNDRKGAKKA